MLSKGRSRQACLDVTGKEMMEVGGGGGGEEGRSAIRLSIPFPFLYVIYIYTHTHSVPYIAAPIPATSCAQTDAHVCTVKAKTKVVGVQCAVQ